MEGFGFGEFNISGVIVKHVRFEEAVDEVGRRYFVEDREVRLLGNCLESEWGGCYIPEKPYSNGSPIHVDRIEDAPQLAVRTPREVIQERLGWRLDTIVSEGYNGIIIEDLQQNLVSFPTNGGRSWGYTERGSTGKIVLCKYCPLEEATSE